MYTPAPCRLLLAVLCLAAAMLACARAEVPIDSAGQSIATALVIPPSPTLPILALASPTSELAEATSAATTAPTVTRPPTVTPEFVFQVIPIPNGTFDTDLSNWSVTPAWTLWQDGYVRANAGLAGQGAVLVQFTTVPSGREVKLHFSARSEVAHGGECLIESYGETLYRIPADAEWHEHEVDFTLAAGTQTAITLQAQNNNNCNWLNFDDVYWLVAGEGFVAGAATATPGGPTQEPGATATVDATATLAAVPAEASFTQAFTVSAEGDNPAGTPGDLVDGEPLTWASLRNGAGAWVFNLGGARNVAGLRLIAHRDGNQDTTVLGIDVSTDGATWTVVYSATGDCAGAPRCQVIVQGTPVDFPFGPIQAQYVRVRSGPTRFALAEVEIAVVGN